MAIGRTILESKRKSKAPIDMSYNHQMTQYSPF